MTDVEPLIDVHAHAVLLSSMGTAGQAGPEMSPAGADPWFRVGGYVLNGVAYRDTPFTDVPRRIAQMNEHGIGMQLLSPNPLTYFDFLESAEAAHYCRVHNDELLEIVRLHPDRFVAAAQLPMSDITAACDELKRCVDLGMSAAYINTSPPSGLTGPDMGRFYRTVTDLNVPLFLHPTSVTHSGPPTDARLHRYDLELLIGFAYDETVAVAELVFGNVLDEYPELDICVSHGGGAIASLAGRFQRAVETRKWVSAELRDAGFASYLGRLWFDTHLNDDSALTRLIDLVGLDQMVYGSNFAGWDDTPVGREGAYSSALNDNARRLLRL